MAHNQRNGFTLIELSIVLVVIGLIVGGILVGRDLIEVATIRQQISQIEKYNTAVHTFQSKYNCLPGDCANAGAFGFLARSAERGDGDGNGVIEGFVTANGSAPGGGGEGSLFWADLSMAGLIEGVFGQGIYAAFGVYGPYWPVSGATINDYLPQAKLGNNAYVYAYSGGYFTGAWYGWISNNINYFGLDTISSIGNGIIGTSHGLTVQQAFVIDTKVDDGLPQSGRVMAQYVSEYIQFVGAGTTVLSPDGSLGAISALPTTDATNGSGTTCYDNGGIVGAQHYSTEMNGRIGLNCALSFQFQ